MAPFSSAAVPPRPLRADKLTGRGLKPVSGLCAAAITTEGGGGTTGGVPRHLKQGFIYVGCTCVVVSFFFFSSFFLLEGLGQSDRVEFP